MRLELTEFTFPGVLWGDLRISTGPEVVPGNASAQTKLFCLLQVCKEQTYSLLTDVGCISVISLISCQSCVHEGGREVERGILAYKTVQRQKGASHIYSGNKITWLEQ